MDFTVIIGRLDEYGHMVGAGLVPDQEHGIVDQLAGKHG